MQRKIHGVAFFLIVATLLVLIDLSIKEIVHRHLHDYWIAWTGRLHEDLEIFTGLQKAVNTNGVPLAPWHLIFMTAVATFLLWRLEEHWDRPYWKALVVGLSLNISGAWGNCADYWMRGGVIDYLWFARHKADIIHHFVFNMADIYIWAGSTIVFTTMLLRWWEMAKARAFATGRQD